MKDGILHIVAKIGQSLSVLRNDFVTHLDIPFILRLWISLLWETLSKAAERSRLGGDAALMPILYGLELMGRTQVERSALVSKRGLGEEEKSYIDLLPTVLCLRHSLWCLCLPSHSLLPASCLLQVTWQPMG